MEKRKQFIINILYITAIFLIIFSIFKYLLPLLFPFLTAFLVAAMLQKPIVFISKKTKIPQKCVAVALIIFILLLLALIIFMLGSSVISNIEGFSSAVNTFLKNLPEFFENFKNGILNFTKNFPDSIRQKIENYLTELSALQIIKSADISVLSSPLSGVMSIAKKMPGIFLGITISIIATFFLSMDYRRTVNFIMSRLSKKHQNTAMDIKKIFFTVILKLIKSYLIIMSITFCEVVATLLIMSFLNIYTTKYIVLISILITLIDILPIFGTGTVFIPWAVYSFIIGNTKMGITLIISYIIISLVRSITEPKIVGQNIGLSPIVTLLSMYVGLKLIGIAGLFIVPILVMTLKILSDSGKIKFRKKT